MERRTQIQLILSRITPTAVFLLLLSPISSLALADGGTALQVAKAFSKGELLQPGNTPFEDHGRCITFS